MKKLIGGYNPENLLGMLLDYSKYRFPQKGEKRAIPEAKRVSKRKDTNQL